MGTVSSEVSLRFELRGPSHVISTGCTSSTDAIGYAFNMIRFGLAEYLITGGVDARSRRGSCKVFASCTWSPLPITTNRGGPRGRLIAAATGLFLAKEPGSWCWKSANGRL